MGDVFNMVSFGASSERKRWVSLLGSVCLFCFVVFNRRLIFCLFASEVEEARPDKPIAGVCERRWKGQDRTRRKKTPAGYQMSISRPKSEQPAVGATFWRCSETVSRKTWNNQILSLLWSEPEMLTEDRQTTFIRATRSKMVSQTKDSIGGTDARRRRGVSGVYVAWRYRYLVGWGKR